MVVPYVNHIQDPIDKYLVELDEEMSSILNRKDLSVDEKLTLYNKTLNKFLNKSNDTQIKITHQPSEVIINNQNNELSKII